MRVSERFYLRRRAALVEYLRGKGIENERVLDAVGAVPRELFVGAALRNRAYEDEALPIGLKQTISQPFTVAYQTMLLDPRPGDRVLEVGTGSGYQAAILCEMGARVFSIERHHALHLRSKSILDELGYRVVARHGDGSNGWAACAPFDGIIVTAGAPLVPEFLMHQLRLPRGNRLGGRLIIPVGKKQGQVMTRIVRTAHDEVSEEHYHTFRFVPLVSDGQA